MNEPPEQKTFAFVPSYNHAPFVERCLRSIFRQRSTPLKLLVIDDGSSDGSPHIIEKILKDCPFEAELIARGNRGLSKTLNEGLARASGEFFAYLGSDDVWLADLLRRRQQALTARAEAVLACGHAYLIDENDFIIDRTDDWTRFAGGAMRAHLLRGEIFASSSVVYRRTALEKHGWNEDSILEDYELYLRLVADGEFAFDDEPLSAWRQHGWNVSGDFPLMLREWIAAQNRIGNNLGMSRRQLDSAQAKLRFDAVLSYIRHGHRREAIRLLRENLHGARSPAHIVKTLFRLAVPPPVFEWNRRRKRTKAIKKYGKLEY